MGKVDLTISIVNYNTKDLVGECLNSIYKIKGKIEFEVIVIDNASSDGSAELIEKKFPEAKLIKNRQNLGFAKANNQAIKQSKGRYILLCNPDVVIRSNSLDKMIEFMETHQRVGALGCKILNPDQTVQTSNNNFPNLFTAFLHIFQLKKMVPNPRTREKIGRRWKMLPGVTLREYFRVYWDSDRIREVEWATAACLLVRRETVKEVGLLDENFFMYYEDTDWCYRMQEKGWKIFYFPLFEVFHYVEKSSGEFNSKRFIEKYKSMHYYFWKHRGKKALFLLRVIICSGLSLRLMGLLMIYLVSKNNRLKLKENLYTYLTVIKGFKEGNFVCKP